MTDQDQTDSRNISSGANYAKFSAWAVVALVLFAGVSIYALGLILTEARGQILKGMETDGVHSQAILSHGHRIEAAEQELVRAEKDRQEIRQKLVRSMTEIQTDVRQIADYVLTQKAKDDALNR